MNTVVEPRNFETKLPPAVMRNAKAAEEMQQQFINQPDPDNPPAEPPVEPSVPPAEPPVEPSVPPVVAQPPAEPDEDTWKHKYQSMQGRYNADTSRLRGQVDALTGQVANLNKLLSTVSAPPADPGFRPSAPTITDEERAEWGDDFVNFAAKLATQEAQKVAAPLLDQIKTLERQVGGVGQSLQQNARERLFDDLDEAIPNWREVNVTPEFLEWLNLQDAYTGAIRHEILTEAFEQNNFPRVAAFFKGFLAELAATVVPQSGEPANSGIKVPKIALETIVAPGRAKSAAATPPPAPSEKPFITASQIAKFYTDVSAGRYKGREAAAKEFEESIFLAQKEGRIRP